MRWRISGALVGWTLLMAPALASGQGTTQAYETWLGVFAQGPIAGRLTFQGDLHYRAYADGSPHWVLVRPGIGWRIVPGMFATLGYAFTPSWRAADLGLGDAVGEHRLWQQWQHEAPLAQGAVKLQVRARLEERWRPAAGDDVGLRARLLARVTVPLSARWLVAVWDEGFVALNDTGWGQRAGFDQNRFFVGPGAWAIPARLRFELGYFNQYLHRAGDPRGDLVNHAAMLNTYLVWS